MTGRQEIIRQLRDYQVRWQDESETVRRFIDFVSSNPDCFERQLQTGHVTGSAWVVNRVGTRVLLTHHRKLDLWVQLGGHADGEADIFRVARREAEEESGLEAIEPVSGALFDIDIHRIPARGEAPEHLHWDLRYAFRAVGSEAYRVSEESHDLAWIEIQSLESVTREESMLRMARKWMSRPSPARG
jgi:8-oxo-dGTP pyrophosphatase MutT (NUDIX family)